MQTDPITLVFRALSDPTRRSLFQRVAESDEITVAEITRGSGVTQGAVSQHLKALKQAGLVADRAQGRNIYYRACPQGLAPLAGWIDSYTAFWKSNFDDLRTLLKELDK